MGIAGQGATNRTELHGLNFYRELNRMSSFQSIAPEELQNRMHEVLLVDVRGPAETDRGIIKGAKLVPLHLVPLSVDQFKADQDIVIYCHSGARSAQACQFLAAQGVGRLFNLEGGVMYWAGSGLPLVAPE
jgi:rhodanese-related sulfurtransferase